LSLGNYFWRVGTPGGCWSDAFGFIVDSANEIGESIHTGLSIFPNPGENVLHIKASEKIGEVVITDVQGKVWIRQNVSDQNHTLDTTCIPQGVYFVRCNGASRFWVKK